MEDRVGVFLGVGDPGDGIDQRQQRLHAGPMLDGDRVHVRQIEDRDGTDICRFVFEHLVDLEPVEERSKAARSALGIQATGSEVVGRRAEAVLTTLPASALSRLDLPTPVPPTNART